MHVRTLTSDGLLRLRHADTARAVHALVSGIGTDDFAERGISALNHCLPVRWWSVYRLHDDALPRLHLGDGVSRPEVVARAWNCYRGELWRTDRTFTPARAALDDGALVMTHLQASEVRGAHRDIIYTALGLSERLSITHRHDDGAVLCVNLYSGVDDARLTDDDLNDFAAIGPLLMSCVESHLRAAPATPAPSPLAGLTRREREVCERLLRGLTYDGVAADLGVSPATVRTYRDRAFDRLGIQHRSQLYARMMEAGVAVPAAAAVPKR